MNSFERMKKAVNFEKTDITPVAPIVLAHSAVISNISLYDYLQDGELLAQCQIKAYERYGYDAIFAAMDAFVETEAVGSILEFQREHYPKIKRYALTEPFDVERLSVPDPTEAGRMPEVLKAASILREKYNNDVLILGCVIGPMSLAIQLLETEKALYLAIDNPEKFSQILEFSKKVSLTFGKAQIKAGAHLPILFEPSSSPAIVPHQFFREFILSHIKEILTEFKKAGSLANCIHIPGNTGSILKYYPELGVNIANFDYYINPLEVKKTLPDICFLGNIKSLSFVESNPEKIALESKKLIKVFNNGGGFILSSGSEIPPYSKPENIKAMVRVAKS